MKLMKWADDTVTLLCLAAIPGSLDALASGSCTAGQAAAAMACEAALALWCLMVGARGVAEWCRGLLRRRGQTHAGRAGWSRADGSGNARG